MATKEFYTTSDKVNRLLRYPTAFSTTTNPTSEQVDDLIQQKMDVMDDKVHSSFHLSQFREYRNIDPDYIDFTGTRIFLSKMGIQTPLSTALGDSLKVFTGSSWEEYVGVKTEGRGNDFWIDELLGILFIRTGQFGPKYSGVDIQYRYNQGARTLLNDTDGLTNSETGTVTVDSTAGFPYQGWFRIDDEEIRYNGKTATTFTSVERGANNTTAATHSDNAVIYWCPNDVVEACTKLVAIDLLTAEDWSTGGTITSELGGSQFAIAGKIESWRKDIESFFSRREPFTVGVR